MSEEKAEEKEALTPGEEPREVFLEGVEILVELLAKGEATVRVDSDGDPGIRAARRSVVAFGRGRFRDPFTERFFMGLIMVEIPALMRATIRDDVQESLRRIMPDEILDKTGIDEFVWRAQHVADTVAPSNLRERSLWRRTAKGNVIEDIGWDVSVRRSDTDVADIPDVPYAVLALSYSGPRSGAAALRFGAGGPRFLLDKPTERVTFEMHRADLDEMIKALTDLRDAMGE